MFSDDTLAVNWANWQMHDLKGYNVICYVQWFSMSERESKASKWASERTNAFRGIPLIKWLLLETFEIRSVWWWWWWYTKGHRFNKACRYSQFSSTNIKWHGNFVESSKEMNRNNGYKLLQTQRTAHTHLNYGVSHKSFVYQSLIFPSWCRRNPQTIWIK